MQIQCVTIIINKVEVEKMAKTDTLNIRIEPQLKKKLKQH